MNIANEAIRRLVVATGFFVIAVLVSGCAGNVSTMTSQETVTISFNRSGCPTAVDKDPLNISKDDELIWQSVPAGHKYRVWLVPFKGSLLSPAKSRNPQSNSDGRTSVTFSDYAPAGGRLGGAAYVEYKYTIQSFKSDGTPCDPLDPHIRVG